jgi:lysophospholipase L1-like esterase
MEPMAAITITAIGDSVMLGAVVELEQAIEDVQVDAEVGRQAVHAVRTLRERHEAGQLGTVVVVHLGSNGLFREEQFDEIMQVLNDVRWVMFVNVRVLRRWQEPVNRMLAEGVGRYANAEVIDWNATSADRPELLRDDGVHLSTEGAQVYAELIASCIEALWHP